MAEKKQISATIDVQIATDVASLAYKEDRSFSQMVEIILRKGLLARTLPRPKAEKKKANG